MSTTTVTRAGSRELGTYSRNGLRLLLVVVLLVLWQWLPAIKWLREFSPWLDPFFVSSPSLVWNRLIDMSLGLNGQPTIWPSLVATLEGTFLGVIIGAVLGAFAGLALSNSRPAAQVLEPFISFFNSAPRVAFVPIFVIVFGPTLTASVLTAVLVVFFLVFYNAYTGGSSVAAAMINNARLLGATDREVMWQLRFRYVLVWSAASLPNAISFGLVAVVTAEILTGQPGMGRLLFTSISMVDSTLTFTVVLVLSIIGATLVALVDQLQRRMLFWWHPSR